jgi:hypothetical protein
MVTPGRAEFAVSGARARLRSLGTPPHNFTVLSATFQEAGSCVDCCLESANASDQVIDSITRPSIRLSEMGKVDPGVQSMSGSTFSTTPSGLLSRAELALGGIAWCLLRKLNVRISTCSNSDDITFRAKSRMIHSEFVAQRWAAC